VVEYGGSPEFPGTGFPTAQVTSTTSQSQDVAQTRQSSLVSACAHLSGIVQFPLNGRPAIQILERKQFPIGVALFDGQQEPAFAFREGGCRPFEQSDPGSLELREIDRPLGHPGEVVGEEFLDRIGFRRQ